MTSRFEKFSERARRGLSLAQEEAQRFNHNYIGTEHILLGLVRETEGVAARVLSNLGVELSKVRSAVEFIIGRGERQTPGEIGLTPRAKKVIELAVDEARRLNHHYIGTEHILIGLMREGEGVAAGVLESFPQNVTGAEVGGMNRPFSAHHLLGTLGFALGFGHMPLEHHHKMFGALLHNSHTVMVQFLCVMTNTNTIIANRKLNLSII